ncbi:tetratricopeptide repeat protein [Gimesia chilikensis]|uniref:tetratricopeptide repeat protein n=1 Tax=Gimesia chilikensis TaxID=2605989 RepID=UPI0011EF0EA8|nr:tetratricopeptide repeat protein [Gimesia chilikensis]KAA0134246.1 tetratricopeptide repeat protein [Gimesia chilikensis]
MNDQPDKDLPEDNTPDASEHAADQNQGPEDSEETPAGEAGQTDVEEGLPEWEPLTPELVEDEAIRGDFMLRWAAILLACLFAATYITDTQTLVHVKTGQYLASHGFWPPANDVFSYTATDRPWHNNGWLFDLSLSAVYGVLGGAGLTLLKVLLLGVTFYFIVRQSEREISTWWGSILAVLALIACFPQLTVTPEIITILGVVLTLYFLSAWQKQNSPRALWSLVPLFLVWANMDSRVVLGIALLLLYALGETVAAMLDRSVLNDDTDYKALWMVLGGSLVATLLNPTGWHSLSAGLSYYSVDYPIMQSMFQGQLRPEELGYFPMTSPQFWSSLNHYAVAAFILMLLTLVSFVLNQSRMSWGQLFVFVGFCGFSVLASHELVVTSVLCAIFANRNFQLWYRDNFRQTYSVETSELLFSRGGRALTVLTFFALAYLVVCGRFQGQGVTRHAIGLGLSPSLSRTIDGYRAALEESLDDRPFHFVLEQGDLLIWLDQKSFVDNRLALFTGTGESDLIALHDTTRRALRSERKEQQGSGKPEIWKATFNHYHVTHVLPRLSGMNPDYRTFFDLLTTPDWQLTSLNAATAVFYRTDTENEKTVEFLASHKLNFKELAFQQQKDFPEIRSDWARPQSIYSRYLLPQTVSLENDVQTARHYLGLMSQAGGNHELTSSFAILAIQKANRGLIENPNSAEAYRILGSAYSYLARLEAQLLIPPGANGQQRQQVGIDRMRYFQILHAYHQSLIIEPDFAPTHMLLFEIYSNMRKVDLAHRELKAYLEMVEGQEQMDDEAFARLRAYSEHVEKLQGQINQVSEELAQLEEKGGDRLQLASQAYQNGFVLLAQHYLDDPVYVKQNPLAQNLQATILMEVGQSEAAANQVSQLQRDAQNQPQIPWRAQAAFTSLGNGNYRGCFDLWRQEIREHEEARIAGVLQTLPLVQPPTNSFWPTQHAVSVINYLYGLAQQQTPLKLNMARCEIEAGQPEQATALLQEIIDDAPDTPYRPMIRFYLYQLTGTLIPEQPEAPAGQTEPEEVELPLVAPKP